MGPVKKIKRLVIDSGAFLKNVPIWDYGEEFFSVSDVVCEIRDKQTKEFIESLPVEVILREPSPGAIKFVYEFTKKIGESNLSKTDLKVLALTYDLELEAKGGSDHLRKEPVQRKPVSVTSRPHVPNKIEGFYAPANHQDSGNEEEDTKGAESKTSTYETSDLRNNTNVSGSSDVPSVTDATEAVSLLNISNTSNVSSESEVGEVIESTDFEERSKNDSEAREIDNYYDENEVNDDLDGVDEDIDDLDDDEGWITPSNIKAIKGRNNSVCEDDYKGVEVACITGDFAMQNTLLHIDLNALGVNGKLIKSLRMYTLRCFVCHTLCSDMERLFCRKCGYKTLKKVSYTLNPDGTKFIWISKRPINTKGMIHSLPLPQGGKYAVNPILCEDQRIPQMRPSKRFLQRNDPLHEDYKIRADTTPFLLRDNRGTCSSTLSMQYGSHKSSKQRGTFYWEKKNSNGKSRRKR